VAISVTAVTYVAGRWAIDTAYVKRGYAAVGGEYLFILMVSWVVCKVVNRLLDALGKRSSVERVKVKKGVKDKRREKK